MAFAVGQSMAVQGVAQVATARPVAARVAAVARPYVAGRVSSKVQQGQKSSVRRSVVVW